MKFTDMMHYAELEGDISTRTGKINAIIKDIKAFPSPVIGMNEFEKILNKYGLSYKELTAREIQRINAGIR